VIGHHEKVFREQEGSGKPQGFYGEFWRGRGGWRCPTPPDPPQAQEMKSDGSCQGKNGASVGTRLRARGNRHFAKLKS